MNKFVSYQHQIMNPETTLGLIGVVVKSGVPGMAYLFLK